MDNISISELKRLEYFQYAEEELVSFKPICFSLNDVLLIMKCIKANKTAFLKDEFLCKSYEKLIYQEKYLLNKIKSTEDIVYYLVYQIEFNPKKKELLQPKEPRQTFNVSEETDVNLAQDKSFVSTNILTLVDK